VVGGKFLLQERVGAGAMGVVYRALDVHLDRAVAIKTLPHLAPAEALRLRREARAIATVTHPNLAVIFGAESWRGQPMLVFEYLGGGTLADRLARRPLVIAEALDLGLALSAVVAAIHDAGVLHCDIKPTNIGFTRDGTPKLLDFGLARVLTAARPDAAAAVDERLAGRSGARTASESGWPGSMSESAVRGTPLYMAPEARIGDAPSPSFDLWSLCVVLYEGLAGDTRTVPTASGHAAPPPAIPDIREFVPAASPAIAGFFRRALSERLAERPASAAALGRALHDLRRDGDIGESAAARGVRPAGAP
jgi:serine/threonine protein kinase